MAIGPFELLSLLGLFAFYLASLAWVYGDAEHRTRSPILVTLLVGLVSWPLGLLLWALFRPEEDDPFAGVLEPGEDPLL